MGHSLLWDGDCHVSKVFLPHSFSLTHVVVFFPPICLSERAFLMQVIVHSITPFLYTVTA